MKRLIFILLAFLALNHIGFAESYIVKFKKIPKLSELQSQLGKFEPVIKINLSGNNKHNKFLSNEAQKFADDLQKYYVIETDSKESLKEFDNIESITPNYIYKVEKIYEEPNDPYFKSQWSLKQINAERAWEKATGKGIVIGLIDTGIDFEHEDLQDRLWVNNPEDINHNGTFEPWHKDSIYNGLSGDLNGLDEDKNGFVDDVIGYDLLDQEYSNFGDYSVPDAIPEDEGRHGTAVAGIMLANTNNEIGISGVAPDAVLLTAKALDATGNGEADDIANAIVYAAVNGADILNFSFGEEYDSPVMHAAIKYAYALGVTMVASSGNSNWYGEHYPSDYKEVICVGGSDETGNKFGLSNYGSYLDLIAPGYIVWTLAVNNEYAQESGTSIAAPIVSAAIAMLKELNPELAPDEIKGALKASARDAGNLGWDEKHGSGVLDIAKLLTSFGKTDISIKEPLNKSIVLTKDLDELVVKGSVITPQFDKYEVLLGKGLLPKVWTKVDYDKDEQVKDSIISKINSSFFKDSLSGNQNSFIDTTFTLAIKVYLKNQNTIEERIQFNTVSDENEITLLNFDHRNAIDKDKSIYFVYAETNRKATFSLKYRKKGTEKYQTLNDDITEDYYHLIKIADIEYGIEYEAIAQFALNNDIKIQKEFEFFVSDKNFRQEKFVRKYNGIDRTYLWHQTADLYNDGKKYFAANDLSTLDIGKSEIFVYDNNEIESKEVSDDLWICRGLGDTDGDGLKEFLGTGLFRSVLYEYNPDSKTYFDNMTFESELGETFWSESLYDIDNDGIDEIIAYNDTSYFVAEYQNGKYVKTAFAQIKPSLSHFGINKGSVVGDFDGDGKNELVHSNDHGFLYVFEYENNALKSEYIDSNRVAFSNQFMSKGDIDGDGTPEILHLSSGSRYLYEKSVAVKDVWYLRIYDFVNGEYQIITDEVIFGVRAGYVQRLGYSYRNGILGGNVDGQEGDEIIISAFPNLYIFKYDDNELKPLWIHPGVLSNDMIVEDFDDNGINEIGFSGFNNTAFYEYQPENDAPKTPVNIKGWALSDTSAHLEWTGSPDAQIYQIYEVIFEENGARAELLTLSESSEITLDSLLPNTTYYFSVVAYNESRNVKFSEYSELAEIYTHNLYSPVELKVIKNDQLEITYDGNLLYGNHTASVFKIEELQDLYPVSAIRTVFNKIVITYKEKLRSGDYNLIAGSILDEYNSPTNERTLQFSVSENEPVGELYLKRLKLLSKSLLKLEFSEKVQADAAKNPQNYEIKPFGNVEFVSIGELDSSFVLMNISSIFRQDAARGFDYTLTARNITSKSGKPMTDGPGNTLGFVVASQTLDDAYIYPNPVRLSENNPVFFANLTNNAVVTVMTLEGKPLRTLVESDGNGGVEWDLKDESGKVLPADIYLFKVEGENSAGIAQGPVYKKFMILK